MFLRRFYIFLKQRSSTCSCFRNNKCGSSISIPAGGVLGAVFKMHGIEIFEHKKAALFSRESKAAAVAIRLKSGSSILLANLCVSWAFSAVCGRTVFPVRGMIQSQKAVGLCWAVNRFSLLYRGSNEAFENLFSDGDCNNLRSAQIGLTRFIRFDV